MNEELVLEESSGSETKTNAQVVATNKDLKHRSKLIILVLCILAIVGLVGWALIRTNVGSKYSEITLLVADKISQDANVVVNLPKGVELGLDKAKSQITFDPALEGEWSAGSTPKQLVFNPKDSMELGKFYALSIDLGDKKLNKNFEVDENPKIAAIYPNANTESSELSEITIVFNRPMIPLTTLSSNLRKNPPVEITPKTEGEFKWITTRNLQFIPKTRLARSTNYTVKVASGFTSMDGLAVEGQEHKFTTRPVRFEGEQIHHQGLTLYNEPVQIRFNQPVDLKETTSKISVKDTTNNKDVQLTVEYGERAVVSSDSGSSLKKYLDKSVVYVYQAKDKFGRSKFWDNKTTYSITINGAKPLEGDINLDEARTVDIQVPDVLADAQAKSDRTPLVEPSMFDPEGKLLLNFYEDIDLGKSDINADKLDKIDYAEKCVTDDNGYTPSEDSNCEKEPNKKQLVVTFKKDGWANSTKVDVKLDRIVNTKGVKINSEPIIQSIVSFPEFKVTNTSPKSGQNNTSATDLMLCSTTPVTEAQEDTFASMFTSNFPIGKWRWNPSYKITDEEQAKQLPCKVGEYLTSIRYGLQPQLSYQFKLHLSDTFGQKLDQDIKFTSGDVANIYKKFYSLQKGYNITTPNKTKLTFAVENLEYVDLNVCEITAEQMLKFGAGNFPSQESSGQTLGCKSSVGKRVDIPKNYWSVNYFQFDLKDLISNPLGYYVISLSNPGVRAQVYNPSNGKTEEKGELYNHTLVNVTNLAVQEKNIELQAPTETLSRDLEKKLIGKDLGNLYWVTEIGSLKNIAGAQVEVYQRAKDNFNKVGTASTDSQGIARTKPYYEDGAAIVKWGSDSTLVSGYTDKFQWASRMTGGNYTYIYSDRPIYRPGQTVNLKGINRVGFDGEYEILQANGATLEVFNTADESVFKKDLALNDNGTFNTSFVLPNDAKLGTYRVQALDGYYYFDVQEYKAAAFKLDVKSDKDEYTAGDEFKVNIDANYYFGVPVEQGRVEYSITTQDYYFDKSPDSRFAFGSQWYYSDSQEYGDNFIVRGKVDLDEKGKGVISRQLDFDKFFKGDAKDTSKVFVVNLTVTNGSGQQISGQASFIAHRGEFYLGTALDNNYFGVGQGNKVLLKTVNTKGEVMSASNIDVQIDKVKYESFKRQEVDGGYYYRTERKLEKVENFSASTNGKGDFSRDILMKDPGEYQVTSKTKDSKGNPIVSKYSFYVYGKGEVDVRPENNATLDMVVDNAQVEVGGKAGLILQSPFSKAKALISIETNRILDYKVVDIDQNFYRYEVPVKSEYLPNFYVTVVLLGPSGEVKFGQSGFNVNTKDKELDVTVTPNKNHYLPSEEVVLDVVTKDKDGKAVSAETSIAVADLSVLALVGNPKKNPVSFFYSGRPLGIATSSNLKNLMAEAEIPSGTKGGGGLEPGDLAKKKRGEFKDTAYWNATVQTNSDGKAQVKFTLPDNLTTWQVESLALTKDTKLGTNYKEFQTGKDLMVVPLLPRFVLPGDEFSVGAKVLNQTGKDINIDLSVESSTLTVADKSKNISLKAGETQNIYFKASAPSDKILEPHKITVSAKNKDYEDVVDSVLPVKKNTSYEVVATSGYSTGEKDFESVLIPDGVLTTEGGLSFKASSNLLPQLQGALDYLTTYPYGSGEQLMSTLSSLASAKQITDLKNLSDKFKLPKITYNGVEYSAEDAVEIGKARILASQAGDGGFTYYPGMQSDFYLTMYALHTFDDLKKAGFKVDAGVIDRAAKFVYSEFSNKPELNNSTNALLVAESLTYSNLAAERAAFAPRISVLLNNPTFINDESSNLTLITLLKLVNDKAYKPEQRQKLTDTILNRVVVDGRGAYLSSRGNEVWQYYESTISDTAQLLGVIANNKIDYPLTDKLIRWIFNARSKDGAWGSTSNTKEVLSAVASYVNWKKETESQFDLQLLLDGKDQGSFSFSKNTLLESFEKFIPINRFNLGEVSQVAWVKKNLNDLTNGVYFDLVLKYFLPIDKIAPRDEGFSVQRAVYSKDDKNGTTALTAAKVGDVVRGHLVVTVTKPRNFVAVEDFIPAGFELVNFNFATEDQSLLNSQDQGGQLTPVEEKPTKVEDKGFFSRMSFTVKGWFGKNESTSSEVVDALPDEVYSGNVARHYPLMPDSVEYKDDRLMVFTQYLPEGVYEYDYYARALIPGKYQHLPATASELYYPEHFGRTQGQIFTIK